MESAHTNPVGLGAAETKDDGGCFSVDPNPLGDLRSGPPQPFDAPARSPEPTQAPRAKAELTGKVFEQVRNMLEISLYNRGTLLYL